MPQPLMNPGKREDRKRPPRRRPSNRKPSGPQTRGEAHHAPNGESQSKQRLAAMEATVPHLATKADVADVRTEVADVRAELADLRTELAETRAELKTDIADVRTELKQEIAFVRGQVWILIALGVAGLVPVYLRFLGLA